MPKVPLNARLALAVSGGPDSMALAYCVKRWCEIRHAPSPLALIVDHGLRAGSAAEADAVKQHLANLGIDAEILRWDHGPITSRLHSEARKARYRLLLEACHKHKISHLLFAHHRDDQAETILMRLAKGSGIDGLAGMAAESVLGGVHIFRPFLTVPKDNLIATCEAAKIPTITDPSNSMEKFARGRLRRVMPLLAEEGLTVERLIDCGTRAAEAKDALEFYTSEFLAKACHRDTWGSVAFDKNALLAVPRAIALRALSQALQSVHAETYAPQHAALSLLWDDVSRDVGVSPRTLNGCLITSSASHITIIREYAAISDIKPIKAGESILWDGRWRVTLKADGDLQGSYRVQALGNPPHDILDRLCPALRRNLPQGRLRATLPALWLGEEIAAIPFNAGQAEAQLIAADSNVLLL